MHLTHRQIHHITPLLGINTMFHTEGSLATRQDAERVNKMRSNKRGACRPPRLGPTPCLFPGAKWGHSSGMTFSPEPSRKVQASTAYFLICTTTPPSPLPTPSSLPALFLHLLLWGLSQPTGRAPAASSPPRFPSIPPPPAPTVRASTTSRRYRTLSLSLSPRAEFLSLPALILTRDSAPLCPQDLYLPLSLDDEDSLGESM